jgi:hypothetical protein
MALGDLSFALFLAPPSPPARPALPALPQSMNWLDTVESCLQHSLCGLYFAICVAPLSTVQPMNWLVRIMPCLQHSNQYRQNNSNFFSQSTYVLVRVVDGSHIAHGFIHGNGRMEA